MYWVVKRWSRVCENPFAHWRPRPSYDTSHVENYRMEQPQLSLTGVAVEKLPPAKFAKIKLHQDALQTTFSVFLDIFYPPNFRCFDENGVFQHPQAIALIERF
jgi:hypothetical protein